jgi:hypothetical protein
MASFDRSIVSKRRFLRQGSAIGLIAEYSPSRDRAVWLSNLMLGCSRTTSEDYPEKSGFAP